jgi:hypothetical protein
MSLAAIGLGYGVGSLVGGGTTGAATANVAQTNGFYDYRDGRAQTLQWEHDKLAPITGGDEAVMEARERIINDVIKNGADPVKLAAALSTPGVDADLNGLAVIEAASIRNFGGRSFNDLTDKDLSAGSLPGNPIGGPGTPREMPSSLSPSATAEDFATRVLGRLPTADELAAGARMNNGNCAGCWNASTDGGQTWVSFRPAGMASSSTLGSTSTVEINYAGAKNAINDGKILKLKFPILGQ